VFHRDRLLAALNKYWRPVTEREYLHGMDIPATNNAIAVAGFPKEIGQWVWVEPKEYGAHFERVRR